LAGIGGANGRGGSLYGERYFASEMVAGMLISFPPLSEAFASGGFLITERSHQA